MAEISFGTDGWRARIAEDYTFENVRICAQAVARYLLDNHTSQHGLVVGYDTRFLSDDFGKAVAEVVGANGIHVYLCNTYAPTPVVSYGILERKAAGAVMITASHNPYIWNGFKYKPEYAGSASPEVVAALEKGIHRMQAGDDKVVRKPLAKLQQAGVVEWFDPVPTYLEHLKQLVDPEPIKNAGLNLVVDAMFGAGMGFFPKLLSGGKTRLSEIHHVHNPLFPGLDHPEPIDQNLEGLREAVLREHAGAGVANDGDADRVGFMDENGVFINQLQVFALLLLYLLEVRGWRGPVVRTVTTTVMADKLARKYNLPIFVTPVGFKYVGPKMIETNAIMGGEESGGFGFRGHIPERDGVVAGMFLLDFMVQTGKTPSQLIEHLYSIVGAHYYERIDVAFPAEQRKQIMQHVKDHAPGSVAGLKVTGLDTEDGFKFDLEDGGWLLIRFSGTEPVLRIYCETTHQDKVQDLLQEGYKMTGLPKKG